MEDQICDQRDQTVGVDGRDRASRDFDPRVAEQADSHSCRSIRWLFK